MRTVALCVCVSLCLVASAWAIDLVHIAQQFQIPVKQLEIVAELPHDTASFTQGLIFHDGALYESTGLYGQSKLRKLDPKSGHVEQSESLPDGFFGEGMTLWHGQLIQLTWQEHTAFIWDPSDFELNNMWAYGEDGWGLTNDGTSLLMSDGSATIYFRSPYDFSVQRTIGVNFGRGRLNNLNELEYVNGKLLCNVLGADIILEIAPDTGEVLAVYDASNLRGEHGGTPEEQPFNGIAYDSGTGDLYVTGKHWSKIYKVKVTSSGN